LSNFEVIDRRRSKPQDEEAIVPAEPVVSIDAPAATRQWKDVAYVLAFMPIQNGNMLPFAEYLGSGFYLAEGSQKETGHVSRMRVQHPGEMPNPHPKGRPMGDRR
jgi:hypothetical protein